VKALTWHGIEGISLEDVPVPKIHITTDAIVRSPPARSAAPDLHLAFREQDGVYLQSRAGRNLTPYFPDMTRAVRTLPAGVVLDGKLMVRERGRTTSR
jgi:hypothetical protein